MGITITAYAPLGSSDWSMKKEEYKNLNVLSEPTIKSLAAKYGKSPA